MRRVTGILGLLLAFNGRLEAQANWPEFRGAGQQGHAESKDLPLKWSERSNIVWKTSIPGMGWSSPVVWGNQIWLTTATGEGRSLRAVCIDKDSGKIAYDIEVFAPQKLDRKHDTNTYASPTPVIEDGRVYVSFGNYGNACLDTVTGRPIWKSNELKLDHYQGPGSSPILYKDWVILNCDGMDVQYIAALRKENGQVAWKINRSYEFEKLKIDPDERKAYSTPIVISVDGKDQLISMGAHRVSGYDLQTQKEIWWVDLAGWSNVPRPVYGDGLLYVCSGYNKADLVAIRVAGAKGDVSNTHIVWTFSQGVSLKPSPLFVNGRIFLVGDDPGIARCLDAKTGAQIWQGRIGTAFTASPLYADGRVYFFSEEGMTTVVSAEGKKLKVLAENELDEGGKASAAVSGRSLFLRSKSSLYRIQ